MNHFYHSQKGASKAIMFVGLGVAIIVIIIIFISINRGVDRKLRGIQEPMITDVVDTVDTSS